MDFPKHYTLKKEHPKTYEIHDSRDNSSIHIPKDKMDLKMHGKLSKLPHYVDGGIVGATSFPASAEVPVVASGSGPLNADVSAPTGATGSWSDSPPKQDIVPMADQPKDALTQFNENAKSQETGLQNMGDAKANESTDIAKSQEATNFLMNGIKNTYDDKLADIENENKNLTNAVTSATIDPNRYVHNMGTGNKILAAIMMGIGGAGAATARQPNIAYEAMQKAISDDIDAQKADLGKKKSLLSVNMQKYGNLDRATQATMMQMNAIQQGNIAQIAAKNGASINQGNTQYMLGALQNQNLMTKTQLAKDLAVQNLRQQALSGNVNPNVDPASLVQHLVPAERQQKVFDEIEAAQNTAANAPKILEAFDNAAKNIHAVDFVPGMDNADQKALEALMGPTFKDVEGTVRQAAMDNMHKNTNPQFGDNDNTTKTKRAALEGYLRSKESAPTAKGFGVDLSKFKSTRFNPQEGLTATNDQGQKIINRGGNWVPLGK